jgi:hypothetical protein
LCEYICSNKPHHYYHHRRISQFYVRRRRNFCRIPLYCSDFRSKLRAPHRGTSLGPLVCGAKHSKNARAPHTNGLRDVLKCTALSLQQKPLHYREIHLNSCPSLLYVGLGPVVVRARVLVHEVLSRGSQGRCPRRRSLFFAGT